MSLSSFSLAAIRNQIDEVRAQVYPKNETERKVKKKFLILFLIHFIYI
jgi:hypothetical protein